MFCPETGSMLSFGGQFLLQPVDSAFAARKQPQAACRWMRHVPITLFTKTGSRQFDLQR